MNYYKCFLGINGISGETLVHSFIFPVDIYWKLTHHVPGTLTDAGGTEWDKPDKISTSSILGSMINR